MHKFPALVLNFLLSLFTWTYKGSLHYYTLEPIRDILVASDKGDDVKTRSVLAEFRRRKEYELHFVQRAATLSAAAVIGVKSWSDAAESFWPAPVAWHCSFFFSIMALISSNQERLLGTMPRVGDEGYPSPLREALLMVLTPLWGHAGDEEKAEGARLQTSLLLFFLWQTPLMLMNYSWLMFLIGYELYLITPLVKHASWTVQCTGAIIATVTGLFVVGQFHVNAIVTRQTLRQSKATIAEEAEPTNAAERKAVATSQEGQRDQAARKIPSV